MHSKILRQVKEVLNLSMDTMYHRLKPVKKAKALTNFAKFDYGHNV
jgi:hypothetical protein